MKAFLKRVAKAYIENEKENLLDFCFIFPNKRSGIFFGKYLAEVSGHSLLLPEITTINDFVLSFTDELEASRYEQLFMLYKIYREINNNSSHDFDKFLFWGDMLLNDFNDADKYMVDVAQLFVNVKRFKELNSNYLTEEQVAVINKYWGENLVYDEGARFWKHIENNEAKLSDKFVKIWAEMKEIYDRFNELLSLQGLTYSGRAYRNAATYLKSIKAETLSYKRYVFIGFNVLSTSEIKIFERLKAIGRADFYWDYNSPGYIDNFNKASRFLSKYVKEFKSLYDIKEEKIEQFPNINIIGVPSNIGQVKEAGKALLHLIKNNQIGDVSNAIDTAVVLPDENLFIPLINSYPTDFGNNINITMGYPMRFTPIAAFMKNIVSMHLRARKIKGEYVYFYEDVQNLLAQPLFKTISGKDIEKINENITNIKLFNVPSGYLIELFPELAIIFKPVEQVTSVENVFGYAIDLLELIKSKITDIPTKNLDKSFVDSYYYSLCNLRDLVKRYDILMQEHTFFHLMERAISTETVTFKGEPLHGLQVMGVLETRALDFKNVIMTSMNERIFPRKHYKGSFIPDALRRSYGMSTIEFQESIYAYYFYRLVSRADNVFLLYNCRGKSGRSGDMSRYLFQLKYLFPQENIKFSVANYPMKLSETQKISIVKTPLIMEKINRFRDNGKEKKYLSASSFKTLIHCPLQFYLQNIEDIRIPDDLVEHMDSATLGTIVHEVMENLYKQYQYKQIKESDLDDLSKNDILLDRLITIALNRNFNRLDRKHKHEAPAVIAQILMTPLSGEAELLADIIKNMVQMVLERDKQFAPFVFEEAEYKKTGQYKVDENLLVNFKVVIDRIDKTTVNGIPDIFRIVDYKTGGDDVSITSISELFDNSISKHNSAILQLMIYCILLNAFDEDNKYKDKPIQPLIYKLRTVFVNDFVPISVNKNDVYDYRDYLKDDDGNPGFLDLFHQKIKDLFDQDVPFEQTKNDLNCSYCKFKMICDKEEHEDDIFVK